MWNQIPNFSKYAVGEEGQIKNVRFDRFLNPSVKSDGSGVPIVTLSTMKSGNLYQNLKQAMQSATKAE